MRVVWRVLGCLAVGALWGCAGQLGPSAAGGYGNPNDIISPSLVPAVCLGADKGAPIYAGPGPTTPLLGYTGNQVAATNTQLNGYGQVLFRSNQMGWVPIYATHPFYRPGFAMVGCVVAGVRPDGTPVFLYR